MKKKCYVYLHKRNDNGTVFYIGKGTSYRVTSKDNRSKQWTKVVEEAGGFTHEKIAENLTSDEAENLESSYILNPDISWELINKKLSTKTLEINKCDLDESGVYKLQGYVESPAWSGSSDITSMQVDNTLS